MAETIKRTLELSVPADEVATETSKVVGNIQQRVRIPGFRPGKAPTEMIRRRYSEDIREEVIRALVPKHFWKRAEDEGLNVAGPPNISDIHFESGEPLRFKAEFEVAPDIELKDYKGVTVVYQEPEVADEDVNKRIEEIREAKAEYVNVDPRPVEDGDYAVVSLESLGGIEGPPIKQDEIVLHIGDQDTIAGFSENLRGVNPGEEREFEVTYPDDYAQERLSGNTVRFRAHLKGIRRKELPELNDEFAQDLGDYKNLEELRDAVRKAIFSERQFVAQHKAKDEIVDSLVHAHEFPVPEAYVERQIESYVERHLQSAAAEGIDPKKLRIDWEKVRESQHGRAEHDIKASLLLAKIADVEAIHATNDEVDREVARMAKQQREPVAALRMRLEKNNALGRIANQIRTEKVLNFLFENARKVAQAE